MDSSPAHGSWYMPAETARHQCVLMAYPNSKSDNSGALLQDAQNEIISIANAIAEFEQVVMFSNAETMNDIKPKVCNNVSIIPAEETSHLWIRDLGPIFVTSRDGHVLRGVNFNFNYWGNKRPQSGDECIAGVATTHVSGLPALGAAIVAEGGGMEVDGVGTFMATESAIINANRNAGKSKAQIEGELCRLLGVHKFLWLAGEVGKETTDCHIDALARFIRPGVVVLSKPSPEGRGKYDAAYTDARDRLSTAEDAQGNPLMLYDCTEPDLTKLKRVSGGENCVASYVNFLVVNGGLIIPKFGDVERDAQALELFQTLYSDRKVVQVYIEALPCIGGGIHCATQHVPALSTDNR